MVRFWSDHFNIDLSKGECKWLKPADDHDVLRPVLTRHAPDADMAKVFPDHRPEAI